MTLFRRWLIIAVLIALFGPAEAWAQARAGARSLPARSKSPPTASALPESVRRVEQQTGGEVLHAEPMQRDGREVYRLKVLTSDGRVRVVQDDPSEQRGAAVSQNKPKQNSSQAAQTSDSGSTPPQ